MSMKPSIWNVLKRDGFHIFLKISTLNILAQAENDVY